VDESCIALCLAWQFVHEGRQHGDFLRISQGRVATHLRSGGIFNNHLTENLLLDQPVKEF